MIFSLPTLTLFLLYAFIPSPRSSRGRLRRRSQRRSDEEGKCRRTGIRSFGPRPGNRHRLARRPRVGFVTPRSGGPGRAVRWHYDRLPSMAGRDGGRRAAEAARIGGAESPSGHCPEARQPGTEKPPVERREAPSRLANGKGTPHQRVGRPRRPLRRLRKPPRFSALRSPSLGVRRRPARGRSRIRAMTHACFTLPQRHQRSLTPMIASISKPAGSRLPLLYHRLTGYPGTAPLPCGCHILWITMCQ
jgi:hypothetical protein